MESNLTELSDEFIPEVMGVINKFTIENWINILGIVFPLVVGITSFIIKSVSDSRKRTEELRPNVFISYERYWKNGIYCQELVLKNYGLTSAIINSIDISPKFESKGEKDFMPNALTKAKNYPLAPNQEIRTMIGASASGQSNNTVAPEERHYRISYKNSFFKKEYISEYIIDEPNLPKIIYIGNGTEKIEIKIDSQQFQQLINKNYHN